MSSTTSTAPVADEQLLEQLTSALDAAKLELAELEPRREMLSARVTSLEHTIAVFRGETPERPTRRRATSTRRKRAAAASDTSA